MRGNGRRVGSSEFARRQGLAATVRGGGNSVAGHCIAADILSSTTWADPEAPLDRITTGTGGLRDEI